MPGRPTRPAWLRRGATAVALVGAVLASGCMQGDFGRQKPSVVAQRLGLDPNIHVPGFTSTAHMALPMSGDETELRLRAYALTYVYAHEPSYGHWSDFASVMPHHLHAPAARSAGGYAASIDALGYRSPEARMNAIIDDVRADETQLERFREVASAVYDVDAARLRDLHRISAPPAAEAEVVARVEENRFVIDRTLAGLDERIAGYQIALGEGVLATGAKDRAGVVLELDNLKRSAARTEFEISQLDARHAPTFPAEQACTQRSLARDC